MGQEKHLDHNMQLKGKILVELDAFAKTSDAYCSTFAQLKRLLTCIWAKKKGKKKEEEC